MNDAAKAPQAPAAASLPPADPFPSPGVPRPLAVVLEEHIVRLGLATQDIEMALRNSVLSRSELVEAVRIAHGKVTGTFAGLSGLVQEAWAQELALEELRQIAAMTVQQLEDGGLADLQRRAAAACRRLER